MRKVLSISITEDMEKKVKQKTKKGGFASVSDYIKHLLLVDESLISEEELLEDVRVAEEDYKKGRVVTAKSLKDLV